MQDLNYLVVLLAFLPSTFCMLQSLQTCSLHFKHAPQQIQQCDEFR